MSAGPTTRVADFGSRTMWNDGQINCFTTLFQQDRVLISRPCYCASCPTRPDYVDNRQAIACLGVAQKRDVRKSVPCGGSGGAVGWDSSALETRPMFVQAGCDQPPRCARPSAAFLADAMRDRLSAVIAGASYVYGRAISREGGGMR